MQTLLIKMTSSLVRKNGRITNTRKNKGKTKS
jgi:hypothetical protein